MVKEEQNPINKFSLWWQDALKGSPLKQKSAVCINTIDAEGFPNGRFVDLKQVDERGFVFCTYLNSQKGIEITANNKVSLTAWWDHIGYQVRVIGHAEPIENELADKFWCARTQNAQLTTQCFQQSQPMDKPEELQERFEDFIQEVDDKTISRPDIWGGFRINPVSIEFLTFRESRLHLREKFCKVASQWQKSFLQP